MYYVVEGIASLRQIRFEWGSRQTDKHLTTYNTPVNTTLHCVSVGGHTVYASTG
jgi:hypothetical protein